MKFTLFENTRVEYERTLTESLLNNTCSALDHMTREKVILTEKK